MTETEGGQEPGERRDAWYLERDGEVAGPFPSGRIKRDIVLGRVRKPARLSTDAKTWRLPAEVPEFAHLEPAKPGSAAFARFDERETERRHPGAEPAGAGARARSGRDRRRAEPGVIRDRRVRSRAVWQGLVEPRPRTVMAWLVVAAASAVALFLAVNLVPPVSRSVDCGQAAAPLVNWTACGRAQSDLRQADLRGAQLKNTDLSASDLAGANLTEADVAYANLQSADLTLANLGSARLVGANLRGARLSHTDMRAADLQYADLRSAQIDGALFDGAQLSHAIWIDGKTCAERSVGTCRAH